MKKWIARIGVFVSALVLTVFLGCALFQDAVSPVRIAQGAKEWVGMDDPNENSWFERLLPWDSVLLGEQIQAKMELRHEQNQRRLRRELEDEILIFGFWHSGHLNNMQQARDFQQNIFSPTGPLGFLIPAGIGAAAGGMFIPRLAEKKKVKKAEKKGKEEGIKEANNKA